MEDNQAFRNATDFLKKKKDVTMIVVAKKLGVSRQVVENTKGVLPFKTRTFIRMRPLVEDLRLNRTRIDWLVVGVVVENVRSSGARSGAKLREVEQ